MLRLVKLALHGTPHRAAPGGMIWTDIASYPGGRSFGAAYISTDVGRNMGVGFCFGVVLLMEGSTDFRFLVRQLIGVEAAC